MIFEQIGQIVLVHQQDHVLIAAVLIQQCVPKVFLDIGRAVLRKILPPMIGNIGQFLGKDLWNRIKVAVKRDPADPCFVTKFRDLDLCQRLFSHQLDQSLGQAFHYKDMGICISGHGVTPPCVLFHLSVFVWFYIAIRFLRCYTCNRYKCNTIRNVCQYVTGRDR